MAHPEGHCSIHAVHHVPATHHPVKKTFSVAEKGKGSEIVTPSGKTDLKPELKGKREEKESDSSDPHHAWPRGGQILATSRAGGCSQQRGDNPGKQQEDSAVPGNPPRPAQQEENRAEPERGGWRWGHSWPRSSLQGEKFSQKAFFLLKPFFFLLKGAARRDHKHAKNPAVIGAQPPLFVPMRLSQPWSGTNTPNPFPSRSGPPSWAR